MTQRATVSQLEAEFADAMNRLYAVGNGLARLRPSSTGPLPRHGSGAGPSTAPVTAPQAAPGPVPAPVASTLLSADAASPGPRHPTPSRATSARWAPPSARPCPGTAARER